ncbi:unnamed protein product [Symbiodinium sp. KB8]|nr:unnamed protein product [Symbiodinium sp. KB8]
MALNSVLGQALSRNKAYEKVDLWKEREIQDKGSRCTISLKSRKGDVVRQVTKVPEGAEVTSNVVNQFETDREENAVKKEDELLARLANGKDPAWRPDQYLSQLKGKGTSKLKLRPDFLRMDPAFLQKVVAEYKAQKKAAKKKKKKKKQKKEKKAAKKDKKDKQLGKTAKKEKKRSKARGSSQDDLPGEEVKKERHEVKEKRRKRIVLDDAGQPTGKEELEVLQVRSKITVSRKHATREVEADTMDEVSVAEARASEIASKLRQKVQASWNTSQASPSTGGSSESSSSDNDEECPSDELEEDSDLLGLPWKPRITTCRTATLSDSSEGQLEPSVLLLPLLYCLAQRKTVSRKTRCRLESRTSRLTSSDFHTSRCSLA